MKLLIFPCYFLKEIVFSFFSVWQDNAGMAINCHDDLNLSLRKYNWSSTFQALSAVNMRKKYQEKYFNTTS